MKTLKSTLNTGLMISISVLYAGCGILNTTNPHQTPRTIKTFCDSKTFQTCLQVTTYLTDLKARHEEAKSMTPAPQCSEESAGDSSGQGFETQEAGVVEADKLQVGRDQIFYLRYGHEIVVMDRVDYHEVGVIELGPNINKTDLYLSGANLLAVSSGSSNGPTPQNPAKPETTITFFKIDESADALPRKISSASRPGRYQESRIVGENVLIHTVQNIFDDLPTENNKLGGVSCQNIVTPKAAPSSEKNQGSFQSFLPPESSNLSSLFTFNIENQEELSSIGALGYSSNLYMTDSRLILSTTAMEDYSGPTNSNSNPNSNGSKGNLTNIVTRLLQIDFNQNNGSLSLGASGVVVGKVKDKWAFKYLEDKGTLLVATTTSMWSQDQSNSLTTLAQVGQDLKAVASLTGFGKHEDIRAVRYVGNIAYVVTFKKTDPLYAIDISNPFDLKLKSELHIPGFSTMLLPFGPNRLIGVGFDAQDMGDFAWYQGIKLSVFADKSGDDLREVNHQVFGSRGSSSEATTDPHGIYLDREGGLVGLPVKIHGEDGAAKQSSYANFRESGAQFMQLGENGLVNVSKYTHKDLISTGCWSRWTKSPTVWWSEMQTASGDINRIRRVDDKLILVSPFGLTALTPDAKTQIASIAFRGTEFHNLKCP